jgi:hypothetical protein
MFVLIHDLFSLTSCFTRRIVFNDPQDTFLSMSWRNILPAFFLLRKSIKEIRKKNHFKGELEAGKAKIGLAIMLKFILHIFANFHHLFFLRPSHVSLIAHR